MRLILRTPGSPDQFYDNSIGTGTALTVPSESIPIPIIPTTPVIPPSPTAQGLMRRPASRRAPVEGPPSHEDQPVDDIARRFLNTRQRTSRSADACEEEAAQAG